MHPDQPDTYILVLLVVVVVHTCMHGHMPERTCSRAYCTSICSSLWPPPCQLPTRTTSIQHTRIQTQILTSRVRVHARAYIPRRWILSTAAVATGAVHLASVSAVLVLHPGRWPASVLELVSFPLPLRRARAVYFNLFLIPFVSLSFCVGTSSL